MDVKYSIVAKELLAPGVWSFQVQVPHIARAHRPGHFVIVQVVEKGERIPLTIADSDSRRGTITLIVQAVGATTRLMAEKSVGESLQAITGPDGMPTKIEQVGHVVVIGGGVGTAVIYPQAKALKEAGNSVTAIIGGRSEDYVILEEELGKICDAVLPCTDDGSYGFKGFVTEQLKLLLSESEVAHVLAAGPLRMMQAIAGVTREAQIPTVASLNPVMIDGTGMCGGCRVMVGGEQRLACADGPEFDAHLVDFDALIRKAEQYAEHERASSERHACRLHSSQ